MHTPASGVTESLDNVALSSEFVCHLRQEIPKAFPGMSAGQALQKVLGLPLGQFHLLIELG
jgi:hypothetical protein